jgi:hypothetical protein
MFVLRTHAVRAGILHTDAVRAGVLHTHAVHNTCPAHSCCALWLSANCTFVYFTQSLHYALLSGLLALFQSPVHPVQCSHAVLAVFAAA